MSNTSLASFTYLVYSIIRLDEIEFEIIWLTSFNQPAFSPHFADSDSIVLPRRCPHPNRELAALGAVSVDPDAVAYADRLTRLEQQREITRTGRIRWAAVIGPRERTGLNVRGTKVDEESSLIVTPVSSIDPGFLTQVSSWQNSHEPNLIRFHPFLSHLVVADRTDLAVCSLLGLDPLGRVNTSDESDTVNRVFRPTRYMWFSNFVCLCIQVNCWLLSTWFMMPTNWTDLTSHELLTAVQFFISGTIGWFVFYSTCNSRSGCTGYFSNLGIWSYINNVIKSDEKSISQLLY